MPVRKVSPFKLHVEKWSGGCGSDQCASARHIVLARGVLPAQVLFVGEAPGQSEDVLGQPFIGPAGRLLDEIIAEAAWQSGKWTEDEKREEMGLEYCSLRLAWTNIVGCLPLDDGEKAAEPSKKQIKSCAPRLKEFVRIAKPKLAVFVGKLAEKHGPVAIEGMDVQTCAIQHPAFLLRAGIADKGLLIQRCVVTLSSAFEDLEGASH